jgi:FAD:protein FMN transferase
MAVAGQPLTKTRLASLLAGLFLLAFLTWWRLSESPTDPARQEFVGETMGTTFSVKLRLPPEFPLGSEALFDAIQGELDAVNGTMSTYQPDSDLSRFNEWDSTEPFEVSPEVADVMRHALQVSRETNGAFDITVGPLVNAYGFGPDLRVDMPTDDELALLYLRVGYDKLSVDPEKNVVSKSRGDVYCDLSAIAKGYGVDRVATKLEELGITDYFVEVGGEVRGRGVNFEGQPWRVGIEQPVAGERAVRKVVPLHDAAMATSGSYRNYTDVDGLRVSHTIDPRIGRPVAHNLVSVSVIHPSCEMADAYATALMVLGPEEGPAFAREKGLQALFITEADDGTLDEVAVGDWE